MTHFVPTARHLGDAVGPARALGRGHLDLGTEGEAGISDAQIVRRDRDGVIDVGRFGDDVDVGAYMEPKEFNVITSVSDNRQILLWYQFS